MLAREYVSLSAFLIAVLVVYIKEALLIFRLLCHKLWRKSGPSGFLTKPAMVVHIFAIAGIACFLYGFFVEPYWIEVKRVNIESEKLSHASIRVIQISDLHTEPGSTKEKKVVSLINSLDPDVIVFTGDSLAKPEALPAFKAAMKSLKAKLGKFEVKGNYDYWFLYDVDIFGDTGFLPADGKVFKLNKDGEDFFVSGLDFQHGGNWRNTLKRVPAGPYSIFLYHKPDLIEDIKGVNVDLYLAGHTHGGQVALPFYGALITLSKYGKRYESGEHRVGNITLYVNRGIGTEDLPIRFFARPEIAVFDIKPKR